MKEKIFIADDNLQHIINKKNLPVGGASVQSYSWYKGFQNIYDVKVLSELNEHSEKHKNILNFTSQNSKYFGFIYKLISINKILKKEKPKAIFVSVAGLNAFIFGTLCKLNNIIYIQRISNDITFAPNIYKKKLGFIKYNLAILGIKKSDIILCQNKTQFNNIEKHVSSSVIHIIYNPFIVENKLVKNDNRNYVAWLGLFQYQKNMTLLLDITKKLGNVDFKIAGKEIKNIDSESKQALLELKKLHNVEFVGLIDREKVFTFLNNAKCLLNTSRYEGFSNTFLESFSTNTPVVTTKKIDPDNIISTNKLGFIAKENQGLVNLISEVYNKLDHNNFNSRLYLEKEHSPDVLAKKVSLILEKSLNDK